MGPTIFIELLTLVAGVAALVGLVRGRGRFRRSEPGSPPNLLAQATLWTSAGVLVMAGANAFALLIGPGDARVLVAGLPLVGVAMWCFSKAIRLRRSAR